MNIITKDTPLDGRQTRHALEIFEDNKYFVFKETENTNTIIKKNAKGEFSRCSVRPDGQVKITLNSSIHYLTPEVVYGEACRRRGDYKDRYNLGILKLINYEVDIYGIIFNVVFPERKIGHRKGLYVLAQKTMNVVGPETYIQMKGLVKEEQLKDKVIKFTDEFMEKFGTSEAMEITEDVFYLMPKELNKFKITKIKDTNYIKVEDVSDTFSMEYLLHSSNIVEENTIYCRERGEKLEGQTIYGTNDISFLLTLHGIGRHISLIVKLSEIKEALDNNKVMIVDTLSEKQLELALKGN